jgi:hypothetical protein
LYTAEKCGGDFGGSKGSGDADEHSDGDKRHALADDEVPHSANCACQEPTLKRERFLGDRIMF